MKSGTPLPLVANIALLCLLVAPIARAAGKGSLNRSDCAPRTPLACPADVRVTPLAGPALHGYLDHSSGLFIKIDRAVAGRVTQDDGCSGPPQYQLYLHVIIRNDKSQPVRFDLVGLAVKQTRGGTYNPFGWGGPYPSHATALAGHTSKRAWIPYYVERPVSFSVWWRLINPNHSTSPTRVARFGVKPTGVKACGR